ncbi:MAG: lytic transglycosylase [Paraburkholderia sp.]|uniref:Type IV secretion system protein VirB1 n=1 Tax=Paraburkholderia terricola TaxID=169427 RepID=A0A1M6J1X9_9BURK|nr:MULTISPECIES: lytic transglycosylase domain-containing protein [Paraburkholderia]TAL93138.1 MAG: lytic transglycosylase [Paraburkholderia sp.]SDN48795.1 type IV secretion system protein VirB1 [Paraburkholderia sediminicola]SHJ40647.1 type IV secretion system protein VirB1 [Paraburkholderia terricola]
MPLDFLTLTQQCAPQISPTTMAAVVQTESGFNPYAIGVVHGRLMRQPSSEAEAIATARSLSARGWRFSVGLAQVNRSNWSRYGLNEQTAFDPCRNLAAGAAILQGCFELARHAHSDEQEALRTSLSCYASGNFWTGFRSGYVQRVVNDARQAVPTPPVVVPAIAPIPVVPIKTDLSPSRIRRKRTTDPPPSPDRSEVPPPEQSGELVQSAVVF